MRSYSSRENFRIKDARMVENRLTIASLAISVEACSSTGARLPLNCMVLFLEQEYLCV